MTDTGSAPQSRASTKPTRLASPILQIHDDHYSEYEEISDFEEDPNVPLLEETIVNLYEGARMPTIIDKLEPLGNLTLSQTPNEFFKLNFLRKWLGGAFLGDGCYGPRENFDKNDRLFPDLQAFKALKRDHQPLLPRRPGHHGAHITCIFSAPSVIKLDEFALFIHFGTKGYKYIGHYREPRAPDLLNGSEMCQLPIHVKEYWAQYLGEIKPTGKSAIAIDSLTGLWAKPPVGWLDTDNTLIPHHPDREKDFVEDALYRNTTAEEAARITTPEILTAFERVSSLYFC